MKTQTNIEVLAKDPKAILYLVGSVAGIGGILYSNFLLIIFWMFLVFEDFIHKKPQK